MALWLTGALLALPVMALRLPPMRDFPLFEAVVSVLRHGGDARMFAPGLYVHAFGRPGQLFYFLAWGLAYVVSVTTACKLVTAITILVMPPLAARLAMHLDRPAWLGMLVAPVMLGWLFVWGAVDNMLGLVILIAAFPALDRWTRDATPRAIVNTFVLLVALYFTHEASLVIACAFVVVSAVAGPSGRRWQPLAAPLLIALLFALDAIAHGPRVNPAVTYLPASSLFHRLKILPGVLYPEIPGRERLLASASVLLPLGWLFARRLRPRATPIAPEASSLRSRVYAQRFLIVALLSLGAYFTLPMDAYGEHLLYHRFAPPAFVLLAILVARAGSPGPRLLRYVALAVPLVSLILFFPAMLAFHALTRDYEILLERIEPGSASMNFDVQEQDDDLARTVDLQGHAVALKGGRSPFDFTSTSFAPAQIAPNARWRASTDRLVRGVLIPEVDLTRYRYVFVRAWHPQWVFTSIAALQHDAEIVGTRGEWILFRSKHAIDPITEGEAISPAKMPASFTELVEGTRKSTPVRPSRVDAPTKPSP